VQPKPKASSFEPAHFISRELSWLEFNQRVLDQAIDDRHPLLERLKFLAIVGSNLDEFFMVRVATLRKRQRANLEQVSPDGLTVSQQLTSIRGRASVMLQDQAECWQRRLRVHGWGMSSPRYDPESRRREKRLRLDGWIFKGSHEYHSRKLRHY